MNEFNTINVKAENGVPFTVRILTRGERYGRNDALTWNDDEPGVEFYDSRYNFTDYGQFVSRYYAGTIASVDGELNLDWGVPEWSIDANTMKLVVQFVVEKLRSFFPQHAILTKSV